MRCPPPKPSRHPTDRGLRNRKNALFFTPKKLKKVISANKIKGFPHAARPKKAVFGLPERAWTYRGHVYAFTRPVKRKPAEGLIGAPLGDGAPPLVGVRLSPYGGNHFPLGILGFQRRRSPPPPDNTNRLRRKPSKDRIPTRHKRKEKPEWSSSSPSGARARRLACLCRRLVP